MKNRLIAITTIVLVFCTTSGIYARVLPVYEELENQEGFIMQNIDMPDLSGLTGEIVIETIFLEYDYKRTYDINTEFDLKYFPYCCMIAIPDTAIGITSLKTNINVRLT
jgi:hypothetical protein